MLFMVINTSDCHIYQCIFLRSLVHEGAGSWLALYRKLLWYTQQGSAIYSWQKRNAQKDNQKKWLRNPMSYEVRENLFTVTSLSFVIHTHTLSCCLSSKQRSLCLAILIEQTHSVSTYTFCNGIKRIEYMSGLGFPSVVKLQIHQTKRKTKPNKTPQTSKTKPNTRGQAMEFCACYALKRSRLLQNKKLLFHSWMIYWMHTLHIRIPKQ